MTQREVESQATFDAGFAFARRLRDPELRAMLRRLDWAPGQHIVMADDDEPVIDVVARMMFHETGGKAIIAIPDPSEKHGFRVLHVEVLPVGEKPTNVVTLGPGASIGMLSAALRPLATYMPSEWIYPLVFERVSA